MQELVSRDTSSLKVGLNHNFLQQLRKIIATIITQDNLLSAHSVI